MTSDLELDTSRIDYLFGAATLRDTKIVQAGLGSGGAIVLERLGMCGVGRWSLYDPDVLEPENLVKHPARRADLGKPKTEISSTWLTDRNPACTIEQLGGDVMTDPRFAADIADADLVICAVDSSSVRSFINTVCVSQQTPCVFGTVFRAGLGGEVYAYLPGETGCYDCMARYCFEQNRDIENWLEMTEEETRRIYGVGETEFTASGMAADISVIASLHAHYTISLLAGRTSRYLTAPSFNWLTISMRRVEGLFGAMYETSRAILRPQETCHLTCGKSRDS